MKLLILPGFSPSNKDWTSYLKTKLKSSYDVFAIDWIHWNLGGGLKLKEEMKKIRKIVVEDNFNMIAKSVGTMVAMKVLSEYKDKVNKIILCGIPTINYKRMNLMRDSLKGFDPKKIICFQNSKDPFVAYNDLTKEMRKMDKKIKVIEKEARNHDYFYLEDFNKFLSSKAI